MRLITDTSTTPISLQLAPEYGLEAVIFTPYQATASDDTVFGSELWSLCVSTTGGTKMHDFNTLGAAKDRLLDYLLGWEVDND